jgi:hypothetical protein
VVEEFLFGHCDFVVGCCVEMMCLFLSGVV